MIKLHYFENFFSTLSIPYIITAIIIAKLGDINRYNNIIELPAYCRLDPSIKQLRTSVLNIYYIPNKHIISNFKKNSLFYLFTSIYSFPSII